MEPSCRVCNNYVLPLFPFTTILNFDQEDKSFANIYETVTQKKVCEKSSTLNEVCLVCSQSIIRAYITINKLKSQSQKNAEVSSINEDFTSTTNYGSTSVNKDKNCNKSTPELKSNNNPTKNVVHTKPKSPKLKTAINDDHSKTLVRCRFCKKILYGHQIAAHAKICTKPDDLKIVLNDSAKSSVKIGSQNARSDNKDVQRNTVQTNTVKNPSLNSEKPSATVNNGKVTKSIDCLLLCRLCNQKLYMSQMNEHKKNCSKTSIIQNSSNKNQIS